MLSIKFSKKCCIIKLISSIIEFISLCLQVRSEDGKHESVIGRPVYLKVIASRKW